MAHNLFRQLRYFGPCPPPWSRRRVALPRPGIRPSSGGYMKPRVLLVLKASPDPVMQERLEDLGFFRNVNGRGGWRRFCDPAEAARLLEWLKQRRFSAQVISPAPGRGQRQRYPCLSAGLVRTDGGGPAACALCGAANIPCRKWIEGDDTDSIQYPGAPGFYMCGRCVRERMQPHPRFYAPADDCL